MLVYAREDDDHQTEVGAPNAHGTNGLTTESGAVEAPERASMIVRNLNEEHRKACEDFAAR